MSKNKRDEIIHIGGVGFLRAVPISIGIALKWRSAMKFEDALKRLEEIVSLLERGDVSLDDSLKLYEEGQELIKFCRDKLTKVETKVKELVRTEQGKFKLKDTEVGIGE